MIYSNLETSELFDRLVELEEAKNTMEEELDELQNSSDDDEDTQRQIERLEKEIGEWENSSDGQEYNELNSLCDEIGLSVFKAGITLIHEKNFVEHAKERGQETCNVGQWPFNHIDWDSAASELQHDYTVYEFQGETYYHEG